MTVQPILSHRPVEAADLPLICAFPQSAEELFFMFPRASHPLTVAQLQQAVDRRTESTVALLDGEVAGFANFYICEPGVRCAIGNVITSPQARGRGVGRYLVETMAQIAWTKYDVKEVQISCFNRNVAGLLLYQKLGFRPDLIEERLDSLGGRVALIHMKRLRPLELIEEG